MPKTPTIKAMGRRIKLTAKQEQLRQWYNARLTDDVDSDDAVYVLLTNRVKIDMAIKILHDVLPTGDVMSEKEYRQVMTTLIEWRDLSWACMASDEDIVEDESE